MAVYRIIPPGDLELGPVNPSTGKRSLVWLTGAPYARQKIASRLKFFIGEWFRDTREGIPYFLDVLVQNPDLEIVRMIFRKVIRSVQEVQSLDKLVVIPNYSTRSLALEFDCSLVSGGVLAVRQPDPPFIITLPVK